MGTAATTQPAAQDPVQLDPKHYIVEFENERVRVLRVKFGPHEKSVMHGHPAAVAVFLTEAHFKFTFPDGKAEERRGSAGQTLWMAEEEHLPENLSDQPAEIILVEQKTLQSRQKKERG